MQSLQDLRDRVEIISVAGRNPERTRAFGERFGVPTTTDVDAVLQDPRVEAVLVLTPPNAHLEIAERCFAQGKHVLLEKPLEVSMDRAERLVAAGRVAGRRLGVVLQHRFRPGSLRLRQHIVANALGRLQAAFLAVPWWRPQSYYDEPGRGTMRRDGGGVLLTQAIHSLDLFRSLVGVVEVTAAHVTTTTLHRMETEDYVSALVRIGDSGYGTIMATTAAYPGSPERIDIIGQSACAHLVGGGLYISWLDGRTETIETEARTGSGSNIMDFSHEPHRALLTDFLDSLRQDRDPTVCGEEALASQRLVDEILALGKTAVDQ